MDHGGLVGEVVVRVGLGWVKWGWMGWRGWRNEEDRMAWGWVAKWRRDGKIGVRWGWMG